MFLFLAPITAQHEGKKLVSVVNTLLHLLGTRKGMKEENCVALTKSSYASKSAAEQ